MTMIKTERVTQIYLGRDKVCRCGCAGEYVARGEPKFEKRLKRFLKMAQKYDFEKNTNPVDYMQDHYLNISYGKDRAMTLYFD
jgi:hypothetical protein